MGLKLNLLSGDWELLFEKNSFSLLKLLQAVLNFIFIAIYGYFLLPFIP